MDEKQSKSALSAEEGRKAHFRTFSIFNCTPQEDFVFVVFYGSLLKPVRIQVALLCKSEMAKSVFFYINIELNGDSHRK